MVILDAFGLMPDDCGAPLKPPERVSMIEALGTVLAGLAAIIVCGLIIVCGVVWASRRRMDQAAEDAAAQAKRSGSGGGGGPTEPA